MVKKNIEMKNDGHDHERFHDLLKTVVNVPKDKIKKVTEQNKKKVKKKGD